MQAAGTAHTGELCMLTCTGDQPLCTCVSNWFQPCTVERSPLSSLPTTFSPFQHFIFQTRCQLSRGFCSGETHWGFAADQASFALGVRKGAFPFNDTDHIHPSTSLSEIAEHKPNPEGHVSCLKGYCRPR